MRKGFTFLELMATVAILAVITVVVMPSISNYVDWTKRVTDRRSLELTNDAINRSIFSYANNPVYTASSPTLPNSVAQNTQVISFLVGSPPAGSNTIIPNDSFLRKVTNATGANYISVGQGNSFHFYDFNRDGIMLGTYSVPHS
jgi:prepilin-type N-terminal cleavage/methylation domain-containing protein